jgi:hypothetical protein
MSLRTALLPVVDTLRGLAGPTRLDIRTYTVTLRKRSWSEGEVLLGTPTVTDVLLTPRPKVREVPNSRDLIVGPITPKYSTGGYSPVELNPNDSPGHEFYYLVRAPDGVDRPYALMNIDEGRPFAYTLTLTALDRKVPF